MFLNLNHNKIKSRRELFYSCLSVFSFLIFGGIMIISSVTTYNALKKGYTQGIYNEAKTSMDICASNLDYITSQVVILSEKKEIANLLTSDYESEDKRIEYEKRIAQLIEDSIGQSAFFKSVAVRDIEGNFYLKDTDVSNCYDTVKRLGEYEKYDFKDSKFVTQFVGVDDISCCLITAPIYTNENKLIGYFYVLINDEPFRMVLANKRKTYKEISYIFDTRKYSPIYISENYTYTQVKNIAESNQLSSKILKEALQEYKGTFETRGGEYNEKVIISICSNEKYGLAVVYGVKRSTMLGAVKEFAFYQGISTLILIILLAFLLYNIYNRTNKPITDMIARCRRIAEGDQNVRFPEQPDKDLNVLGQVLNNYREKIEQAAFIDPILGIGNRIKYYNDVDFEITNNLDERFTLFLIDIANFSRFNEIFSTTTGDKVLEQLVIFLCEVFHGLIYRIDGDVFLAINSYSFEENEKLIVTLQNWFESNIIIDEKEYAIDYNIGICDYPKCGKSSSELLENAQTALKYTKKNDDIKVTWYDEKVSKEMKYGQEVCGLIREALDNNTIEVWYQPIYNVNTKSFTNAEALLRMRDRDGMFLSPFDVVRVAEKNGLIDEIGDMVLKKACNTISKLNKLSSTFTNIHVNLSVLQMMQIGFADRVKTTLDIYGVLPEQIGMEVTETVLIQSFDYAVKVLGKLKEMGIPLALDDFGSGYSSINYLSKLPLNALKLDRGLVLQIAENEEQFKLVSAVIQMAKSRKLMVVAEGVEDVQMADLVTQCGCDYIQGFYFSKPLSELQFFEFAQRQEMK